MKVLTLLGFVLTTAVLASPAAAQQSCDRVIESCDRDFPGFLLTPVRGWCYLLGGQMCEAS